MGDVFAFRHTIKTERKISQACVGVEGRRTPRCRVARARASGQPCPGARPGAPGSIQGCCPHRLVAGAPGQTEVLEGCPAPPALPLRHPTSLWPGHWGCFGRDRRRARITRGLRPRALLSGVARLWFGSQLSNWKEDSAFEFWCCLTWVLISAAPPHLPSAESAQHTGCAQTFKQKLFFLPKSLALLRRRVMEAQFPTGLTDQRQQLSLSE